MYTLIGNPKNRSFRALWALEELGLAYEINAADPRSEAMLAVNPTGKSPAMVDAEYPDQAITDSAAIVQYLADKHRELSYSAGTIERAQQDAMLHFVNDEFDSVLWMNAKHKFAYPKEYRRDGVIDGVMYELARSMAVLEDRLAQQSYLMGERFTVPDIVLGHCIGWLKSSKLDWPETGPLNDYARRLTSREAYLRAAEIRKGYLV
ncbi:MAG: glutathione S-transferase family protein [Gammaproteobacteria bacterium]|nr:glutathione S-transferase family protein [Gammaproteobacteria bacterium]